MLDSGCLFGTCIFCSTNPLINAMFCLSSYAGTLHRQNPLLQVSFCEWQTTTAPDKNYYFYSKYSGYKLLWMSESFHLYVEILQGKYPNLKKNTKPHQLIKQAKNSYSIVSLVFRNFLCGTYRNGLSRSTTNWGTPSTSKSTNHVRLIPFILLHRVLYLKNLFMSRR